MTNPRRDHYAYILVCGSLVISLILFCLGTTTADMDLWGYLAFGRLFWEQGRFPYVDVFSYVPTLKPWVYHEWLTGVLFCPLYESLGGPGLQAFKYAIGLATFGLIFSTARRLGGSAPAAGIALAMIAWPFGFSFAPVRAQVFTYFFFALTLYVLENYRIQRRRYTFLPLGFLFALWANLHGGFVAGLGLIALYGLGEAFSHRDFLPYTACLGLALLATLINPYGWHYWDYLVKALTMPRPELNEWASIYQAIGHGTFSPMELTYMFSITLFSLLVIWRDRRNDLTILLILGVTFGLSIKHIRHLPFFLIALGVYLPRALNNYEDYFRVGIPSGLDPRHRALIMASLMGVSLLSLLVFIRQAPFCMKLPEQPRTVSDTKFYPIDAIDYLKAHNLSGKLLVFFDWGAYALWNLYPDFRVAIDGRYETVYPQAVRREYFDFLGARGNWRQFLNRFPPDFILLPANLEIAALLQKDRQWKAIYAEKGCILFQTTP